MTFSESISELTREDKERQEELREKLKTKQITTEEFQEKQKEWTRIFKQRVLKLLEDERSQ